VAARPPLPPFTEETARQKVQLAEDAWNTRDPERVAGAYSEDSVWRNRGEFITGRAAADRRIFGPRPESERGRSFPLR
jgi:nuclear transport factor 2 (NTF2) superfamily protein